MELARLAVSSLLLTCFAIVQAMPESGPLRIAAERPLPTAHARTVAKTPRLSLHPGPRK